jgi:hypothetical protein
VFALGSCFIFVFLTWRLIIVCECLIFEMGMPCQPFIQVQEAMLFHSIENINPILGRSDSRQLQPDPVHTVHHVSMPFVSEEALPSL